MKNNEIVEFAKSIYKIEIEELVKAKEKLSDNFVETVKKILECRGKVVITGIGKTGLVGRKICATLASTGTKSMFMNSTEGLHGDLGMVGKEDLVIAISNSGESDEIVSILPAIKNIGSYIIALTGNVNSRLAKASDLVVDVGIEVEGCPLNLAPMSSTTSVLVFGDALAATLMKLRNFQPENFAMYHPGGSLGRKLLTKVENLMHSGEKLAICNEETLMENLLIQMSSKRLGILCVMEEDKLVGIITEGDIRRALQKKEQFFNLKAKDIMTKQYVKIDKCAKATEALVIMENRENQISVLPVFDGEKFVGVVRIHDLLKIS